MQEIKINKNCEGYIWYSDRQKPEMIRAEKYSLELDETKNPFVVEGQIYSKDEQVSYSIKYVDGKYIVVPTLLNDLKGFVFDEKSFIPNRLDGVAKIKYRQYWKPEKDELCEGMEVLVPAEYVFVGFEYNNINKEDK
jgi:CRISPR type III-associated protein (TIGR04423 family)